MLELVLVSLLSSVLEFLPISSTLHLRLLFKFFNIENLEVFLIFSQLGITVSLLIYYRKLVVNILLTFFSEKKTRIFCYKIAFLCFVSTVFGLFITKITESFRYNTKTSAISLILLGIVMVFIEKIKNKRNKIDDMKSLSWKQNFFIGTMQSFSMIPGVSRSGVTICAGLFTNMTKEASIQYSFFVSVFINILSCIFDTRNSYDAIKSQQFSTVFIIFILNFIFSLFFIKKVLNFLLEVRLKFFGYYRVIIGLLMLLVL